MGKIKAKSIVARIGSLVLAAAVVFTSSYQVSFAADTTTTSTTTSTYVSPENQKLNSITNKSIRVDINRNGNNVNDYNEYFWNNWMTTKTTKQSTTIQGVTFTLTDSNGANVEPGYSKYLMDTSANNPRKTMDGVKSAVGDALYLRISGLSEGIHSIQTIHSSWDKDPSTSTIGTVMSVTYATYVPDASLNFSINPAIAVKCPNFIYNDDEAGVGYLQFNVEKGKDVAISIKAADPAKAAVLNAFILDGADPAKTISKMQPEDGEMHFDESLGLSWQAAAGAISHDLYFGTDYDSVNAGTTSSNTFKGNQTTTTYALKDLSYTVPVYWWRVDEHLASGEVIKGETLAFRPRRLAFPTAEGYGRFATGGRGGRVVEVTNLNDSGEGSLRQALEVEKGPRTVIFRVGGVIPLKSRIKIPGDGGDVYIAGQTAPGDGITVTRYALGSMGGKDIIIRDIRLRVGDVAVDDKGKSTAMDGLGLGSCFDSIIDHCSVSWGTDENISSRGSRNITYQKNIIAEPLNNSVHYNDQTSPHTGTMRHAYDGTVSGNIGSFYRNLMTNATSRTLSMGGGQGTHGQEYAGYVDITNNVVYNFQYRMADGGCKEVNFVNNYYKMGPESVRDLPSDPNDPVYSAANDPGDRGAGSVSGGVLSSLWFHWVNNNHKIGFLQYDGNEMGWNDIQKVYVNGNKEVDIKGNTVMGTSMEENWANVGTPKGINYATKQPLTHEDIRSDEPFFPSYVNTMTADDAYLKVLSDVGATKPKLDKYDTRYVNEVRNGTYTYKGSKDGFKGYIDSQKDATDTAKDAEGYPVYPVALAPADTDHDGMTDEWETAHKLNPNDASDGNACTLSKDGYSNLEVYLNELAGDYDDPAQLLDITTSNLPDGRHNSYYDNKVSATGGTAPYTWSESGLPQGMGINTVTGDVYGVPESDVGTYTAHVTVTDSNLLRYTKDLQMVINSAAHHDSDSSSSSGSTTSGDTNTSTPTSGNTTTTTPTTTPASGDTTAPTPAPSAAPVVPGITVDKPAFDTKTGVAKVPVDEKNISEAFEKATADKNGVKAIAVEVPKVDGATSYTTGLPASILTAKDTTQKVELKTGLGSVVVPSNMLSNKAVDAKEVGISIGAADTSKLPEDVKTKIGNRPVIDLNVTADDKKLDYNNPDAPVSVAIPYTPTAEELQNAEHIVVLYIDDSGKAMPVSSGKYDSATGTVVFTTTHFSKYAIAYVEKTFSDIDSYSWAKDAIEVMAAKGIINGSSETAFEPSANITRADFTMLLVKSLGLTANADSNFGDVKSTDYYFEAVGTAKKLGIVNGQEDNNFNPMEEISRQDMMVIAARAMKIADKLAESTENTDLSAFSDKSTVSDYAMADIANMVKAGLVKGDNGNVNPLGKTTRAEAAVLLYRIYNK